MKTAAPPMRKHRYVLIDTMTGSVHPDQDSRTMDVKEACHANREFAQNKQPFIWVEQRFVVNGKGRWPALTARQEQQIAFMDKRESGEVLGMRYRYEATCHDCQATIEAHAAITIKDFVRAHSGHNTWTQYFGKGRADNPGFQ